MGGVGTFMKETRTLWVSEFKISHSDTGLAAIYEVIWRHFHLYGEIEDINILPNRSYAFIRFKHRCMAEFAKEAMTA